MKTSAGVLILRRTHWLRGAEENNARLRKTAWLSAVFLAFAVSAPAATIDWSATGSGGGQSTNGNTSITGTIGQSDAAAPMTSGNSSLIGGFWAVADPAFTTVALLSSANPSPPGSNVTFNAAITNDADIQSPGGSVQFYVDGSAFGSPAAVANNLASLTTSSLSHAIHAITASYVGDANFLSSSNLLSPNESINTLPVAPNSTLGAVENTSASFSVTRLLARVTDADGDVVGLTNFTASTTQGGTISLNGGTLTYTPATNFFGFDTFSYTVADSLGGQASGVITVTVSNPDAANGQNMTLQVVGGGGVRLVVAGTTGKTYQVQYTDTLSPANWQNLGSFFVMPSPGITLITDSGGNGSRYYRTQVAH